MMEENIAAENFGYNHNGEEFKKGTEFNEDVLGKFFDRK